MIVSVAPATAPRPIVHPEHARRLGGCFRRSTAQHGGQGGSADRHGQAMRQARSGFAAEGEADVEFCQHSRQTWHHELDGELRLRCLKDGERSGGTTEMKQATAASWDVLVVAGLGAAKVAEFVIASAESLR